MLVAIVLAHGALVAAMRLARKMVYFGEAGRSQLLYRVGAQRARAFVVTVNTARSAERMVAAAKQINSAGGE